MTYQTPLHILIVDDDESICRTLSAILQSEGYQTTSVFTAREAIEKTKTLFFNITLLDIKLPDMEGTKLLAQLQETTPETIKIMITGYPSLKNAVEALKFGADSYIMKPIDPAELLKTIKDKLEAQKQAEKVTKEKIARWVQLQAQKAQSTSFQEFLDQTASELSNFGLTKTQAKIYTTIIALGVASASEIAALSKIRREEVYRVIPELERHGVITRKLKVPRKFSAVQPETAIQILTKTKLKAMKEEIDKLRQGQAKLTARLKSIELPTQHDNCSIEAIPKQDSLDNLFTKGIEITQNAKQQIDVVVPLENLKYAYLNCPKHLKERLAKTIRIRVVTESHKPDAFTEEIKQYSETSNNQIELRQIEKLPFNLILVDDSQAIWGDFRLKNQNAQTLWTNNQTQIAILTTSFESIWQKSIWIKKDTTPDQTDLVGAK